MKSIHTNIYRILLLSLSFFLLPSTFFFLLSSFFLLPSLQSHRPKSEIHISHVDEMKKHILQDLYYLR